MRKISMTWSDFQDIQLSEKNQNVKNYTKHAILCMQKMET